MLMLKSKINAEDFDINLNPTPFNLMNRDIPTLINCPLVGMVTGLADLAKTFKDIFMHGGFGNNAIEAIVNGKFKYKSKEVNFSIPLKPIDINLMNSKINLVPLEKKTYIGFTKN